METQLLFTCQTAIFMFPVILQQGLCIGKMASKRSYLQAAAPILSTYSEGIISTHRTIFNFQHRYRPSPSIIEFPAGKNISIKSGLIRHREPINLRDQKISLFKTFGIGNIFPIYISLICFCK